MGTEKLFTREQLDRMGARTLDLLQECIAKGDKETAGRLSQRMYDEFRAMHDLYRDGITQLLSFIGRGFGDEVLYKSIEELVSGSTRDLNQRYAGKDSRAQFKILIAGLRGHLQPLKIDEDEERFIITVDPCGSGGCLIRDGGYGPSRNFLKIEKAQPMTFNRPDFPVYCAHCHLQNIIPGPGGKPLFITQPGDQPGKDPCRLYFYK